MARMPPPPVGSGSLVAAAALAAALALLALPGAAPAAAPQDGDPPPTCAECHEEEAEGAKASIHGKVVTDPALDGCALCHAGGDAHVKAMQDGTKAPRSGFPAAPDCLLCHGGVPARHGKTMPSFAARKEAACTACHRAHEDGAAARARKGLGPFDDAAALERAGAKPLKSAACDACHDAPVKGLAATSHGKALAHLGEDACVACHGNGSLHAESGGAARLVLSTRGKDAAAQAALCLRCHEKDAPDHARDFAASPYSRDGKSCATCHGIHRPAGKAPEGPSFRSLADAAARAKPVGSARCAACHAAPHPGLAKSRHAPLVAATRGGCESCHGNGSAHADTGGRVEWILGPSRLEGPAKDGICLSCHAGTSSPAAWARHPHAAGGVGCRSCHDPFAPPGKPAKKSQPDLCVACHALEVAQFRLPNRHPVPEGAIGCSDCHDLHRPEPRTHAAKRRDDACASCHRAEAGPRLFPHGAHRIEGCVACHEPHGSPHPRLLRFPSSKDLCLSCHVPPPTHDMSPGTGFANCLACHTEIHGSDADRKLLR
jgi:DmsE family decaheme c-type cytochrome